MMLEKKVWNGRWEAKVKVAETDDGELSEL
jgi:hypothetical protein